VGLPGGAPESEMLRFKKLLRQVAVLQPAGRNGTGARAGGKGPSQAASCHDSRVWVLKPGQAGAAGSGASVKVDIGQPGAAPLPATLSGGSLCVAVMTM